MLMCPSVCQRVVACLRTSLGRDEHAFAVCWFPAGGTPKECHAHPYYPTTTDNEPSPQRATGDKPVSPTALCERFGLTRNAIPRYVAEGMPGFRLDSTRRVFPANECEAWLAEGAADASADVGKHRSVHA